jgi:hypothetical protein
MSLSLGSGLGLSRRRGVAYSSGAAALFGRMTVQPDATRRALINDLFIALENAGILDKLDALWMLAAHTEQAAKLNWIGDRYNLTAVNSPTFNVDAGFVGDGATSYLDSGFAPGDGATYKCLQNDHHLMGRFGSDAASGSSAYAVGTDYLAMKPNADDFGSRSFSTSVDGGNSTSIAHWVFSRSSSASYPRYRDGAQVSTETRTSAAPSALSRLLICCRGTSSGGAASFSTQLVNAVGVGGALTAAEVAAYYTAIDAYLSAVGSGGILLSGDAQSGTDALLLSGDMQSGTDLLELSGV